MPCYWDHHQPPIYFGRIKNKPVILVTFLWVKVYIALPQTKLCQSQSLISNSFSSAAFSGNHSWAHSHSLPFLWAVSPQLFVATHRVRWGNSRLVTWLQEREGGERVYFQFLKLGQHTAAQTAAPAQLRACTGTKRSGCARGLHWHWQQKKRLSHDGFG